MLAMSFKRYYMTIGLISSHVQISGIGFVTLSSMLLTMLTRYWWATKLTWMKANGYVLSHSHSYLLDYFMYLYALGTYIFMHDDIYQCSP